MLRMTRLADQPGADEPEPVPPRSRPNGHAGGAVGAMAGRSGHGEGCGEVRAPVLIVGPTNGMASRPRIVDGADSVSFPASVDRAAMTVLVADVSGYCRLIEADEYATALRIHSLHSFMIEPLVQANRGQIVDRAGDGVVAAFEAAAGAVTCAVELQRRLALQELALPATQRIRLRIGISTGEIIALGGKFYGRCINVAARLQVLSKPGAIYLSDQTFAALPPALAARCRSLGARPLRKMAGAVLIYRIPAMPVGAVPRST